VLTGSARLSQEARDKMEIQLAAEDIERKQLALEHRRKAIDARVEALRAEFKAEEEEFSRGLASARLKSDTIQQERTAMAKSRKSLSPTKEGA
jgi:circadian clock protein KaiC